MVALLRLENGADPKSRRSEQVARSEAECQEGNIEQDSCIKRTGSHLVDYAIKHYKAAFNYNLARAFDDGWKNPEVIQSYSDMINGIPQCGITGKKCPFIDCKANDKGKFRE